MQAGIEPGKPVADSCIATLNGLCGAVREGVGGGPQKCVACLNVHMAGIVAAKTCPLGPPDQQIGAPPPPPGDVLSQLAVHVYCM